MNFIKEFLLFLKLRKALVSTDYFDANCDNFLVNFCAKLSPCAIYLYNFLGYR